MRERPILFSAPMVLALLAGTKTQTRRIVKTPASPATGFEWSSCLCREIATSDQPCVRCGAIAGRNPYGTPGDRLWVRESIRRIGPAVRPGETAYSEFIADGVPTEGDCWPWKNSALPSIHCPRGLSRITLDVVSVRVERLQEISEPDAKEEGVTRGLGGNWTVYGDPKSCFYTAKHSYESLWESINGAGSWTANPWVWVITFKRTEASHG